MQRLLVVLGLMAGATPGSAAGPPGAAGEGPVQGPSDSSAQGYAPADPQLPLPLGSSDNDQSGPVLFLGSRWGGGWAFSDGSCVTVLAGRTGGLEATWSIPVLEDELNRCSVFAGTAMGARHEQYLGLGFAVETEVGAPFLARLSLTWWPTEYIHITRRWAPLGGSGWDLSLRF
jgi:hypothetical protein